MKIGINAIFRWGHTGVGNYICNLVSSLSEIDRDNDYYIFVHDSNKKYFSIEQRNFHFINCKINTDSPVHFRLWEQVTLPRMAKYYCLNILHCPMNILPMFLHCRSVLTIIDTLHFQHPDTLSLLRRNYNKLFIRSSYKRADAVITISQVVKEEINRFLGKPKKTLRVTPLGVDRSFRKIEDRCAIEKIKRHYHICHEYILFVGYPHSRKNIPRLLSAFEQILHRLPKPYVLVLAGDFSKQDDSDVKNIQQTIDRLGLWDKVVFTGYVPQEMMPLLINGAELLAFPSIYEGFGLPTLEAMACETPVLASDIPVFRETIGEAGHLVDPYSIEEIADGLYRLLMDRELRKKMVHRGIEKAELFRWEKTAQLTLECYQDLLQSHY